MDDGPYAISFLPPLLILWVSIASKSNASWLHPTVIMSLKLYFPRACCSKSKGEKVIECAGDSTVLHYEEKKCYASCQAVPPNHSNIISHCSALSPKERMFPITLDITFNLPNIPWQPTNHSRCYHTSRHLHFPNTGSEKEGFYVSKRSVKL